MGRLVNYGPGEMSDRLTILALKILHGEAAGKDVSHFKTERAALLTQIRSRTLNGVWFEAVLELGAVNSSIWQGEDDLRQYRAAAGNGQALEQVDGMHHLIVPLAFSLQALNDRRADLIAHINKSAGELVGPEKVTT